MRLRSNQGFVKLFNYVLNDIDTVLNLSFIGREKVNKKDIAGSSVRRREILRKFLDLISTSELNVNARECVEGFRTMKGKIIAEVGPYYIDNSENEDGFSNIKI
ncbi:hypothetical protein M9H77_20909 [Catharanthus roseus]|uniref:Uncharacterized protein n=1 Tax=Catharanthus roseus TaxID=4058 RepID=A0ACC0ALI7_CATRO|nr:hypothetical protein M9H77_20909 [Catharanthus roseus]